MFSTNSTLTSVKLCENHIGLPGVKSLCRHLDEKSVLAELSLKGNNLDDRAAPYLRDTLKAMPNLTKAGHTTTKP